MTKREFLQAVVSGAMTEELQAFAQAEIEKMDAKNEARKAKPSKASVENAPIKAEMIELLKEQPMIAADLAEALDISTQKVSSLARQLADIGQVEVSEVKIPKKGKRKLYTFIGVVTEEEDA